MITCSDGTKYEVKEVAAPENPQYIEHAVAANGFVLPTYKTMFKSGIGAYPGTVNTGCPVSQWQVTDDNTGSISIP